MRGLIVDNFAGGGGASTGIEMAIGRSVDIAINHDPDAIAMHTANHPNTLHYCESVFDVDPVQATAGRPVDLCWLSPDCKHFSKAKGGKPVNKEIRGLAWIGVRWALLVRPKVLMLENVEEFKTWGPVVVDLEGRAYPCPERKGETFEAFVAILSTGIAPDHPGLAECCDVLGIDDPAPLIKGLGYKVEYKELRACDYGAPTIRKRLFMVARCDGRPVVWPEPTHGAPNSAGVKSGKLLPYRTAAECIDFTRPITSIFDRPKWLALNTLKRIAKGTKRFVIDAERPFIVTCNHGGDHFRGQSIDEPFNTIVAAHDAHGLVKPGLAPFLTEHANASNQRNMAADEPMRTICAQVKGGHFALVNAQLAPFAIGIGGPAYARKPKSLESPMNTLCATQHSYVAAPVLMPMPTSDDPIDHQSLVFGHIIKMKGTNLGQSLDQPLDTITAGGNHFGEIRSLLVKYYGSSVAQSADDPLGTVTTRDRFSAVNCQLDIPPLTEQQRLDAWWVARFMEMYGPEEERVIIPAPRKQFISVGKRIMTDLFMRMVDPDELFLATSFPADYKIDRDAKGNKVSKKVQVARCGNAVPPVFAEALTRANLPELCTSKQEQAA